MPFGAELTDDRRVRFRLWAPAAKSVELVLPEASGKLSMKALEDGWFEVLTDAARRGQPLSISHRWHLEVPDPASRFNRDDVHGPSVVIDAAAFEWDDDVMARASMAGSGDLRVARRHLHARRHFCWC